MCVLNGGGWVYIREELGLWTTESLKRLLRPPPPPKAVRLLRARETRKTPPVVYAVGLDALIGRRAPAYEHMTHGCAKPQQFATTFVGFLGDLHISTSWTTRSTTHTHTHTHTTTHTRIRRHDRHHSGRVDRHEIGASDSKRSDVLGTLQRAESAFTDTQRQDDHVGFVVGRLSKSSKRGYAHFKNLSRDER